MQDWLTAMGAMDKGRLSSVYVLVGEEFVLAEKFVAKLETRLDAMDSGGVELTRFRFDDEGCGGAVFACRAMSLFGSTSLVVLENCSALLANGKSKYDTAELEDYVAQPIPGRTLVITVNGPKLDERKKLAKALKKYSIVDCTAPKDNVAIQMVGDLAKEQQILIEPSALGELWRRTLGISACQTELLKLWAYTDGQMIGVHDVQNLVARTADENIFHWIGLVVTGQIAASFHELEGVLRAGNDAFSLFALLARQLRMMWYGKVLQAQGQTLQQIASRIGAHPYALRAAADQARAMSPSRMEKLLVMIADAEYAVKSGRQDANLALEYVIAACAVSEPGRRRVS